MHYPLTLRATTSPCSSAVPMGRWCPTSHWRTAPRTARRERDPTCPQVIFFLLFPSPPSHPFNVSVRLNSLSFHTLAHKAHNNSSFQCEKVKQNLSFTPCVRLPSSCKSFSFLCLLNFLNVRVLYFFIYWGKVVFKLLRGLIWRSLLSRGRGRLFAHDYSYQSQPGFLRLYHNMSIKHPISPRPVLSLATCKEKREIEGERKGEKDDGQKKERVGGRSIC